MKELTSLEERRKVCPILVGIGTGAIALGVILLFTLAMTDSFMFPLPMFLCIFPGIILIVIGNMKFRQVQRDFKNAGMNHIVNEVLPGSTYQENMGIPLNDIYKYGLLQKADRHHMEDLISGTYKDVKFRTCDLRLEERRVHHNGKTTTVTYVPYFTGRFFEFDFNKNFKGNIVVTEAPLFHMLGMQKISLESEEFNKKFKTFASDEFSAFYVLTPQLMMTLLDLEKANPGAIMIAINSNKIAIAINNNRDTFSIRMNQSIDESLFNYLKKDLTIITDIVNELNLNDKIFKEGY